MTTSKKSRRAITIVILGISTLAWVLLLFNPGQIMTVEHCHVSDSGPSQASVQMLLEMNPVPDQLAGWALMVIAMMLPKLIMPIQQIYGRSFKRHRFPSSLLFSLGYLAVWMLIGFLMIAAILGSHLVFPNSYLSAIGLGIIAIVWQFSPVKQRCLNSGHDHGTLAVFGWLAYRDALLSGAKHGIWCVGSGWAIMLFPMLLPNGHNLAMVGVTLIMLSEHLEHPRTPRWRIDFRAKLFRIAIAQTQMKLKRMQSFN
jgi:predicted metal-binding membrane protein